jgi:hypothetical protein
MGGSRRVAALAAAAAAAAASLLGAPAAVAEIAFGPPADVPVSVTPLAIAPAGGLVALLASEPAPQVALADPSGAPLPDGFVASVLLPPGAEPVAMAMNDLDGDGGGEIAVASSGTNAVSVIRRTDAGLAPPVDLPAGQKPSGLAIADVTGDGRADVAVAGDAGVTVLAGDGAGGLAPAVPVPAAGPAAGPVVTADFDLDRRADLLLVTGDPACPLFSGVPTGIAWRVLLGQAAGGFPTSRILVSACAPVSGLSSFAAAAADLSGDGVPELAYSYVRSSFGGLFGGSAAPVAGVRVGRGDGSLILGPSLAPTLEARHAGGPTVPAGIALSDLDGDGRTDLIYPRGIFRGGARPPGAVDPRESAAALAVFRNLGGGAFGPLQEVQAAAATGLILPMDVDGDGALDLVLGRGATDRSIAVVRAAPLPRGRGQDLGDALVGGAGSTADLEVQNAGVAGMRVTRLTIEGPAAGDFAAVADGCGGRALAGGGRCAVTIRFRPTAAGARRAEAVVALVGLPPLRLDLAGAGLAPAAPAPAPAERPPTARTGCAGRWSAGRAAVSCGVALSRIGPGVRVSLRLVRAGRTWARAQAAGGGRIALRPLRPLVAGRYTTVVLVSEGDLTREQRRAFTLRPARARAGA